MATTYLFLKPARLPLLAAEMTADSVLPLEAGEVGRCLREAFPALQWQGPADAAGDCDQGWLEFHLMPAAEGGALSMRCSLRADYRGTVQALCDRFGWVAFDEAALCFQPQRAPMKV